MTLFNFFKQKNTDACTLEKEPSNDTKQEARTSQENTRVFLEVTDEVIQFCENKLTELFRLSHLEASVVGSKKDNQCIYLDIESDIDSGRIIGKNGATIESLQILIKAMVIREFSQPIQLLIDVGGYIERRIDSAKEQATLAARKLSEENTRKELNPMSAPERRAIHVMFKEDKYIKTFSIGEGQNRRLVLEHKQS